MAEDRPRVIRQLAAFVTGSRCEDIPAEVRRGVVLFPATNACVELRARHAPPVAGIAASLSRSSASRKRVGGSGPSPR
jgi:hypothetical protein